MLEATSSAMELAPHSPSSGLVSVPYKGKSSPAGRLDANEPLTHANEFPIKSSGWELKGCVTKTTDSRRAGGRGWRWGGGEGAKDSWGSLAS